MTFNLIITTWLLVVTTALAGCVTSTGEYAVHSQTAVRIELIGYSGLSETSIFKGDMDANTEHKILTPYRGLAILAFTGGQRYPVVLGEDPFTLNISDPSQIPTFTGSTENEVLYKSLSGKEPVPQQYDFVHLMIQARELLESTHSIKTINELTAKKKEIHEFIDTHYQSLRHSDMVMRLTAQYFMMHEYVNYHIKGEPATAITVKYNKEILSGVGNWLTLLKPHIPGHEILNYCVSLYYKRSMVTLASKIIDNFQEVAYCPGDERDIRFPDDLLITEADGNNDKKLADFKGRKIIAFVSEDCPASMVTALSKARQLARQKDNLPVIIAPLEKLSKDHLAMANMIREPNMFFIDDEQWRTDNLAKKIKLPLFVYVE